MRNLILSAIFKSMGPTGSSTSRRRGHREAPIKPPRNPEAAVFDWSQEPAAPRAMGPSSPTTVLRDTAFHEDCTR